MRKNRKGLRMTSLLLACMMVFSLAMPLHQGGGIAKAASVNLLDNGGFEDGDLTGWNTGGNAKFTLTQTEVRSGDYALQVSGPQNWNGIKYTVAVQEQTEYRLSFYGKGAGGAAYKVLRGSDEDTIAEEYTGNENEWREYAATFNSGDNESVVIYVSDADGVAYYDDFTLLLVEDDGGAGGGGADTDNLVQNGGFEAGDLTSWNAEDTTASGEKFTVTSAEQRSGDYSLKLEAESQIYNGIKNVVAVNPNTTYVFSFYMKGAGGSYFKVLDPADDAVALYESQTTTAADWRKHSAEFNSGSNTSVIIYVSDMAGVAYFDDFSIIEKVVPQEPSAQHVSIAGAPKAMSELTGQYDYKHPQNISEGYSIHTWLQADSVDGEYAPIPDSYHLPQFVLTNAQAGKFIKFQVTPLDREGMLGTAVTSEVLGPIVAADLGEQLLYEVDQAQEVLAAAVEGDGIGQYSTNAINALQQVIDEAALVAADDNATEEQLQVQMNELLAAQVSFDQARVKKPSQFAGFITTQGDKLMEGAEEFKFISYNLPGGLFNEDEQGGLMPSAFELEDAMRTVNQTGGKVVRTYTLTVKKPEHSDDVVRHIMGPGVLNEEAFQAMDKLLELANDYGVRLIIPFFDHWGWSPGGISELAAFRGIKEELFTNRNKAAYTNPVLISDYKLNMEKVMNRVNSLTGVRYKDDPAILAWETGNELMVAPAWEQEIAAHYKKVNDNQLFVNGNQIVYPDATSSHSYVNITEVGLNDPNFDIVKSHYYNGNYAARVAADKAMVAGKKPFFVGEFGLKPTAEVEAMLNSVIDNGASGALLWSLRPHSNNGGFVRHSEYDPGDGIVYSAYHWPGLPSGDYQDSTNVVRIMREKAYEIDGLEVPPMPKPEPAPQLFESDAVNKLRWRGSTGASSYVVERSESESGPWDIIGQYALDDVAPGENMFVDLTAETGKSYYYRVKGVNSGGESDYSEVMGPIVAQYILEDRLENNSKQYYSDDASIVYRTPSNILSFNVTALSGEFTFFLSNDGIEFTEVTPTKSGNVYSYTLGGEVGNELKIVYPNGSKAEGQITRVSIEYLGDGSTLTPIKPLIDNGIIVDEMIDFASMSAHSGNVQFVEERAELAGGDQSRLVRTDDGAASIQYRSLGNMSALKLEAYYEQQPTEAQYVTVLGSSDGVEFTALETEVRALGGEWFKVNFEIEQLPDEVRFVKIVYPGYEDNGAFPQISRVQIGVGAGKVAFPVDPPAAIIDNGEYYGGESLLVNRAYTTDSTVEIGLDSNVKSDGQFGLKYSFQLGEETSASATKALSAADRSAFDTLQFWVKPDGYERKLIVELETENQQKWQSELEISGIKGYYVNLPIAKALDMSQLTSFTLTVVKGDGSANGTIYFDNIQFIQTQLIDSFDDYADASQFAARYSKTSPDGNLTLSLDSDVQFSGTHSMKIAYDFKSDGYGGVITSLPHVDWSSYDAIQLWLDPNGAVATFVVQVKQVNNEYFETTVELDGSSGGRVVKFPFADFDYPSWYRSGGTLNPKNIVEFNIYLNQISGAPATGTIYVDQIEVVNNQPGPITPGPIVVEPETPQNDGKLIVEQPRANEAGQIIVPLAADTKEVIVSANSLSGKNSVVLARDDMEMEIPAQVLEALKALVSAQELAEGAQLSFKLDKLSAANVDALLKGVTDIRTASMKAGAASYGLTLAVVTKEGQETQLTELLEAMTLKLAYSADVNPELLGVYTLDDEGKLEYVGGTVDGDVIVVAVNDLKRYIVLEYDKDFADVGAEHWSSHAVKVLTAKHIVTGVSDTQFQPNKAVTRAEFAALIVRALGLKASGSATFTDVDNSKWYAEPIAAAFEAGVISGRSERTFAPDDKITREEMAIIIVKAYEAKTKLQASGDSNENRFADGAAISSWAQEYVNAAVELGLIQGRGGNKFAPQAEASRAESAQIIYRMLDKH